MKKSLTENLIFCAILIAYKLFSFSQIVYRWLTTSDFRKVITPLISISYSYAF